MINKNSLLGFFLSVFCFVCRLQVSVFSCHLFNKTCVPCSHPWVSRGHLHQGAEEEWGRVSPCTLCEYFLQCCLKSAHFSSPFITLSHDADTWHQYRINAHNRTTCIAGLCYVKAKCVWVPLFQAIYMFYALAIVCDDYFVPSLEKISEVRKTSPSWPWDINLLF